MSKFLILFFLPIIAFSQGSNLRHAKIDTLSKLNRNFIFLTDSVKVKNLAINKFVKVGADSNLRTAISIHADTSDYSDTSRVSGVSDSSKKVSNSYMWGKFSAGYGLFYDGAGVYRADTSKLANWRIADSLAKFHADSMVAKKDSLTQYLTPSSLLATLPLVYNSGTRTFSSHKASSTDSGYVVPTDVIKSYLNAFGVFVSFSTDSIPEGTNLYFTNARARAAVSAGYGLSYNSSTGVFVVDTSKITTWRIADSIAVAHADTIAGGDLTGSYPNPTIKSSVNLSGNPTTTTQASTDNSTRIATTAYVTTGISNAIAAVNPAVAVQAATTSASNTSSYTYNNGVSGIGATLTGVANTALTVDGYTFTTIGQRILVKNDTQSPSGAFNGVYYVSQVQTVLVPVILTRALDYDQPSDMNNTGAIPVVNGTVNGGTTWVLTSSVTTVGTDPLTFTQFSLNPSSIVSTSRTLTINGTAQDLSSDRTWTILTSGTSNRISVTNGSTNPTIDISASYVGQSSITTLGTVGTGVWNGTKIGLAYGGTNADLSATGGASNYLKQSSSGAAITVGTIPASDIASPQNLSVGTSLQITSGTGTGATLQALTVNAIQDIRTTASPQFASELLTTTSPYQVLTSSLQNKNVGWLAQMVDTASVYDTANSRGQRTIGINDTLGANVWKIGLDGTMTMSNKITNLTQGTTSTDALAAGRTVNGKALTSNITLTLASADFANQGTTTTLLHGNAAGNTSFSQVGLTTDVTGTLGQTNGGTGLSSLSQGDIIYGSATNTFSALAKNTTATRYLSNTGTSNNPAWAQVNLANGVTGTLPIANGGTNNTSFTNQSVTYYDGTKVNEDVGVLAYNATTKTLFGGYSLRLGADASLTDSLYCQQPSTTDQTGHDLEIISGDASSVNSGTEDLASGRILIHPGNSKNVLGSVNGQNVYIYAEDIPSGSAGNDGAIYLGYDPVNNKPKGHGVNFSYNTVAGQADATIFNGKFTRYGDAAPGAGKFLRGDGTTYQNSTLTIPNAATTGDIFAATASNAMGNIAAVTAGSYLRSAGTSTLPVWSTLTLPNSATTGDIIVATGTNALGSLTAVAAGKQLISNGTSNVPVYAFRDTVSIVTGVDTSSLNDNAGRAMAGMAKSIAANETWWFDFALIDSNDAGGGGSKFNITVPSGATIRFITHGCTSSFTAFSDSIITASGTNSPIYNTASSAIAPVRITGMVQNGSTAGVVQLRMTSQTTGKRNGLKYGSSMYAYKQN